MSVVRLRANCQPHHIYRRINGRDESPHLVIDVGDLACGLGFNATRDQQTQREGEHIAAEEALEIKNIGTGHEQNDLRR
jgi:hypothetical protein